MLINNKNIIKVDAEISSADFYNTRNKKIYETILSLENKIDVNYESVLVKLKGNLCEYFLSLNLDDCVPHDLNLPFYISEIKNCSIRRKQIDLSIKALNDARNESVDPLASIEELKNHLESSQVKDTMSIVEGKEIYKDIDELYIRGLQRGLFTGWNSLDNYYTIRPGEITLVTGIPSHGKSTFVSNLIVNIAIRYGWKFAEFTPENQPLQRHAAHILQMYIKKPFDKSKEAISEEVIEYSKEWLNSHFVFIQPKDDELQFSSILKKALICVLKYGVKGLVIDPWNEVDHTRPSGLSETEYISKCLTKLRYFARTYQVHCWLIAHPTKLIKKPDGSYPVPTPYDISGSAHFRNKADCCLTVWRDLDPEKQSMETEIHIQKIRFHEVGRIGVVKLKYEPRTQSYTEIIN